MITPEERIDRGFCELADAAAMLMPQPFRAGDRVRVLLGDSRDQIWLIAVYEAATDLAYIAGWPCTLITKATKALAIERHATDEEHTWIVRQVEDMQHGDPRKNALARVRANGGTP